MGRWFIRHVWSKSVNDLFLWDTQGFMIQPEFWPILFPILSFLFNMASKTLVLTFVNFNSNYSNHSSLAFRFYIFQIVIAISQCNPSTFVDASPACSHSKWRPGSGSSIQNAHWHSDRVFYCDVFPCHLEILHDLRTSYGRQKDANNQDLQFFCGIKMMWNRCIPWRPVCKTQCDKIVFDYWRLFGGRSSYAGKSITLGSSFSNASLNVIAVFFFQTLCPKLGLSTGLSHNTASQTLQHLLGWWSLWIGIVRPVLGLIPLWVMLFIMKAIKYTWSTQKMLQGLACGIVRKACRETKFGTKCLKKELLRIWQQGRMLLSGKYFSGVWWLTRIFGDEIPNIEGMLLNKILKL